jgi:hypothetical protein
MLSHSKWMSLHNNHVIFRLDRTYFDDGYKCNYVPKYRGKAIGSVLNCHWQQWQELTTLSQQL